LSIAAEPFVSRFALPPAETSTSPQPRSITHHCDYMLHAEGMREFYYSYLVYAWRVDDATISAKHYLDKPGLPTVTVMMPFEQFDQPKYADILADLQRRYLVIETFETEGYTIRWISASVRLNPGKQRRGTGQNDNLMGFAALNPSYD
jgi:hypothetical protein